MLSNILAALGDVSQKNIQSYKQCSVWICSQLSAARFSDFNSYQTGLFFFLFFFFPVNADFLKPSQSALVERISGTATCSVHAREVFAAACFRLSCLHVGCTPCVRFCWYFSARQSNTSTPFLLSLTCSSHRRGSAHHVVQTSPQAGSTHTPRQTCTCTLCRCLILLLWFGA